MNKSQPEESCEDFQIFPLSLTTEVQTGELSAISSLGITTPFWKAP